MRDVEKYERDYMVGDFEQRYQVKYRRKKVLEVVRNLCAQRILEIGCGMSSLANYLDDFQKYTIVEPGETFINVARRDLQGRDNINFIQGFFEECMEDLKKRRYSLVVCSSLLHEIEDPKALLRGIGDICDEETVVHVNVPNEYSLHRLLAYKAGYIKRTSEKSDKNILLQQASVFNLQTLQQLIREAIDGVEILESGSYFVKPFTHAQMERMLESGIIDEKVLDGLYEVVEYMPELGSEIFVNFRVEKWGGVQEWYYNIYQQGRGWEAAIPGLVYCFL